MIRHDQIDLRAFPREYDERFRGVQRRVYGVPVDLTGDAWTRSRVLDHSALVLNGFSPGQVRALLLAHTATHLFARRYTEDSLGALVQLKLSDELPPREAVYVEADAVERVLEAYARFDAWPNPSDPRIHAAWDAILAFLRRARLTGCALLCFSALSDREYE